MAEKETFEEGEDMSATVESLGIDRLSREQQLALEFLGGLNNEQATCLPLVCRSGIRSGAC